jgi:glycosyltransferase involved in cell wall biosynthesis
MSDPQSILVVPYWSQSDAVNFDSNYSFLRQTIPEISKLKPEWLFFVLWPETRSGADVWRYTSDGFWNDKIIPVRWPYDTSRSSSILSFNARKFQEIDETYCPTVYWLHQVESGFFFKRGYRETRSFQGIPRIVTQHHYTAHKTRESEGEESQSALLQMIGCLASDRIIANSTYASKMAMETFGHYLNLMTLAEIHKKTTVLRFGLVPKTLPETKPYPKPIILYNHRFEGYKRPQITANIIKKLKQKHQLEVWITQTTGQPVDDFPFDKTVGHPLRDQYLENIAYPCINTMNSQHETFCISILDSIMLGHIPVVPRALAFPELLPFNYPYLFESTTQQEMMLDNILTRWPEAYNQWSTKLREWAREHFGLEQYAKAYADILETEANAWKQAEAKDTTIKGIVAVMEHYQEHANSIPISVKNATDDVRHKTGIGTQAFPYRRAIREFGSRGAQLLYHNQNLYLKFASKPQETSQ